jgi:phi13 family phage major tail protein
MYADDQACETISSEAETKITLKVSAIPLVTLANITSRVYDAASGRMWDNAANTIKYFALGFRSLKSNGSYRYFWFLKGKFEMPAEDFATKGAQPDLKTVSITYTAIKTVEKWVLSGSVTDGLKREVGDADATNFAVGTWLTVVQTPSYSAAGALALSSSTPPDGSTTASRTADITMTFNNAIIGLGGIQLILASDASPVALTSKTVDSTNKIVTINPSASLAATTAYIVFYHVQDVFGQTLDAAINFTTVA